MLPPPRSEPPAGLRAPVGAEPRRPTRAWSTARIAILIGVLAGAGAWAGAAEQAMAQPLLVEVRGRSQLQLSEGTRRANRDGTFHLTVNVQLSDGATQLSGGAAQGGQTGQAGEDSEDGDRPRRDFAEQPIRLRVSGPDGVELDRQVRTGADGRITEKVPDLVPGRYFVHALYPGDVHRDRAESTLQVDLGKYAAELSLQAPTQIGLGDRLHAELRLRVEGQLTAGPVSVRLNDSERRLYLRGGLGEVNEAVRALPGLRKGDTLHLIASYAGTEQNGAALARADVLITSQAQITLDLVGPPEVPQGAALTVTGQARDEDGPLAGEAIELEASDLTAPEGGAPTPAATVEDTLSRRLLGTAVTDGMGGYRLQVPRLALRPGSFYLAAQVRPRGRAVRPARSAELPLVVLPPEPVSAWYYAAPLLLTGVLGLLYLLVRWLRPRLAGWLEALRARQPEGGAAGASSDTTSPTSESRTGDPGVSLVPRKQPALTLWRTTDATVDGCVLDASFGRAVAGAEVVLQLVEAPPLPAAERTGTLRRSPPTGEDGRFALAQLPPGRYVATVSAPGYLPQRFTATVPHRGELRGVTVRLEPLRVRLLGEWRRLALRLLSDEARVLTATPRELLELAQTVRVLAPPGAEGAQVPARLHELTELVERAYYSPRLCTDEMLAQATRLADSLLSLLSPGATVPPTATESSPQGPEPLG
jgi:hypothetical protein